MSDNETLNHEKTKLRLIEVQFALLQYQRRDVAANIERLTSLPQDVEAEDGQTSLPQDVEAKDGQVSEAYALLAQSIKSGQCTAAQVEQHMSDPLFAAYFQKVNSENI